MFFSTYPGFNRRIHTSHDEEGSYPVMSLSRIYPHGIDIAFTDATQFRQFLADCLDYLDSEWPEEYGKLVDL